MNLPYAVTAMIALLVVGEATLDSQDQVLPIDRWLISDAIQPDSSPQSRLGEELLEPPGEVGVLPDRGREAAGSVWSLLRNDTAFPGVSLEATPRSVVYAHVYVRLPEDRTLRLAWSPEDCTAGRLWLNGRPTTGHNVPVRFGAGWNTILLKLEAGQCDFGFRASLVAEDPAGLVGVRVQASRPPGDVRTGPDPWAIPHDTVLVARDRLWREDRLFAGLAVRVTAWGRSSIPGVRVELKGAAEGRAESPWMTPGQSTEVVVPVRLDRLSRVLQAGVIEGRLRWEGGDEVTELAVAGQVDDPSSRIILDGWEVGRGDDSDDEESGGQLPNGSGWTLSGEWKVPADLAGRGLVLATAGSPADYMVNGSASTGETVELCSACSRGTTFVIEATTTGSWERMPVVQVSDPSGQ